MKKLIVLVALVGCWGMAFGQNTFPASGNTGIGTTSPTELLDVRGVITGGTNFGSHKNILDLSGTGGLPAVDITFPNNSKYRSAEVNVTGTSDPETFFQGIPSTDNGFVFIESWGGAGLSIGTGRAANPVIFRVNRAEVGRFASTGNFGIGTINPQSALSVKGKIESQEVQVKTNVADYVFKSDYNLMSLEDLEIFIHENGHLPNIQNDSDVEANRGLVKLGELSISLMEKVEELTLHMIELNKRLKSLETENRNLKEAINKK